MHKHLIPAAAVAAALLPNVAIAGPVVSGFNSGALDACDDCSSGAVALPFAVNFFGQTYADVFVSNNGYLNFVSAQSNYSPEGLTAAYRGNPIIAAFYADLDTRPATASPVTYGIGTYDGRTAFGATYANIAQYSFDTSQGYATFQIILTDRVDTGVGNFDIYFNYDTMPFTRPASVGYANGSGQDGTYYQLPGSLQANMFDDAGTMPLNATSNDGVTGQYAFAVRSGAVTVIPGAVPEPASWAMMVAGFGAVGGAMRRRRPASVRFA